MTPFAHVEGRAARPSVARADLSSSHHLKLWIMTSSSTSLPKTLDPASDKRCRTPSSLCLFPDSSSGVAVHPSAWDPCRRLSLGVTLVPAMASDMQSLAPPGLPPRSGPPVEPRPHLPLAIGCSRPLQSPAHRGCVQCVGALLGSPAASGCVHVLEPTSAAIAEQRQISGAGLEAVAEVEHFTRSLRVHVGAFKTAPLGTPFRVNSHSSSHATGSHSTGPVHARAAAERLSVACVQGLLFIRCGGGFHCSWPCEGARRPLRVQG